MAEQLETALEIIDIQKQTIAILQARCEILNARIALLEKVKDNWEERYERDKWQAYAEPDPDEKEYPKYKIDLNTAMGEYV